MGHARSSVPVHEMRPELDLDRLQSAHQSISLDSFLLNYGKGTGPAGLTENLSLNLAMSSIISFMPCSRQLTRCSYASWYSLGKTSLCKCSIGGPGTVKSEVMAVSARWIGSRKCAGKSIRVEVDERFEGLPLPEEKEEDCPCRWWCGSLW